MNGLRGVSRGVIMKEEYFVGFWIGNGTFFYDTREFKATKK